MARASTNTLLSLDRYASIMGINPAHFGGAATPTVMPVNRNACSDIWRQYNWQWSDAVSREELAQAISSAEYEIARLVGYWPAPTYVSDEMHRYPHHHRRDARDDGTDVYGLYKGLRAKWGRFIQAGQRKADILSTPLVGTPAPGDRLVYSAVGSAVVDTVTVILTTTLTDVCEIKVYFPGHSGDPEWEIRPARSKSISGTTATLTFWAWQFIDPDLWEELPTTDDPAAINYDTQAVPGTYDNLVQSCDVYREYCDYGEESCQFFWEPSVDDVSSCELCGGSGCLACTVTVQDGCIHVRDVDEGLVVPALGSYDSDEEEWTSLAPAVCREPDMIKLWYWAGDISQGYLDGTDCDPLSHWWAETIAWLATARLERPFCSCANVTSLAQKMRTDLALLSERQSFSITPELLSNPLGTKYGEVLAWQRLSKLASKRVRVAVL